MIPKDLHDCLESVMLVFRLCVFTIHFSENYSIIPFLILLMSICTSSLLVWISIKHV